MAKKPESKKPAPDKPKPKTSESKPAAPKSPPPKRDEKLAHEASPRTGAKRAGDALKPKPGALPIGTVRKPTKPKPDDNKADE